MGNSRSSDKYEVADNFPVSCAILAELWNDYREEEEWAQFASENDVGLFLAYMVSEGLVRGDGLTSAGRAHISDTWEVLCYTLDADAEADYENVDDLFEGSRLNPLAN